MPRVTARRVALLLAGVLGVYLVVVADRGLTLVRDGRPAFVLLGIGVLLLPIVGLAVLVLELRFGRDAERLGRDLDAPGGSPADEPGSSPGGSPADEPGSSPGGRTDRSSRRAHADALFERCKAEVEAAPQDWRAWYRLAVVYGDAGDTARGRRALRRAIALHRARSADR